jgi:hypothetical protein
VLAHDPLAIHTGESRPLAKSHPRHSLLPPLAYQKILHTGPPSGCLFCSVCGDGGGGGGVFSLARARELSHQDDPV